MGEKYRKLERTPWKKVSDREYSWCDCPEINGVSALIRINEIDKPLIRTYDDGEPVKIMAKDCYWIQFAPRGEQWWLTCMLDENGAFKHAYFDVTGSNHINGTKSWFYDLYLDVVIKKNGSCYLLDEDELKEALDGGEISEDQYNNCFVVAKQVMDRYGGDRIREIEELSDRYFALLSSKFHLHNKHVMHLDREPFEKIASGEKTVEIRLFDEKRQLISPCDTIEFVSDGRTLEAKVTDLWIFDSFRELFETDKPHVFGFDTENTDEMVGEMRRYYSAEQEKKYGVVGIRIKTISGD